MSFLLTVIAVASGAAVYVAWLAARVRRLHTRCAAAERAVGVALTRRALAVNDTVVEHAAQLADTAVTLQLAAQLALHATADEREAAESDLTRALQAALRSVPVPVELLRSMFDEVLGGNRRVEMARALYNDAVRDTYALRRRWLPRALRLSAHLRPPRYFDIDTALSMEPSLATPAVAGAVSELPKL